jgi:very-short-patch-repair endonuclease
MGEATPTGTTVRFRCGHGAAAEEARIILQRDCPLCMLLRETKRSRAQLLRRAAPYGRPALDRETRIGATYEWVCTRGHSVFQASVREMLTGPGCPKCQKNAQAPAARHEGGVPFMKPGLKTRTSAAEQKLRRLLGERIRLPHRVNAIRINRTFYGKPEVWPDIIIPALKVAIEYDSPGRDKTSHRGLKEVSDREKDAALEEVGWAVIRVRADGLEPLGRHSMTCSGVTDTLVDDILTLLVQIRGDAAVAMLLRRDPGDQPEPTWAAQ